MNMNIFLKKGIACIILIIFFGASVLPGTFGNNNMNTDGVNAYESIGHESDVSPRLSVSRADFSQIDFHVSLQDNFNVEQITVDQDCYQRLSIPGGGHTVDYGKPELPTLSFYIAVPQEAKVAVDYSFSDDYLLIENLNVYPSQPPKTDVDEENESVFIKDTSYYSMDKYSPKPAVLISPVMVMRGCRMAMITIFPVSYNPSMKTLKVYRDVDISVDFVDGTNEFIPERLRSPFFQPIFDSFVLNSPCLERASGTITAGENGQRLSNGDRADLLIVVYDDFYDEILPLAQWRHKTGIETKVVNWSEIGSTAADLRAYVNYSYYHWELPPSFLLIVGDADHVPVNYLYEHPYHNILTGSDHWYVAFEGDDYLPELHTGRISVDDENQLVVVVGKILSYCKTPYMEENWFDNVLLAAKEESGRYFVWTSETIYDYLSTHGYDCNRQYKFGDPPGSTQGVIDAINDGVFIANHRDHGGSQNWGDRMTGWWGPEFSTFNVTNDLSNGEMYPVMFSLNCMSGWFDGETDEITNRDYESIGEVGIRVENRGFVAVIAATRVSYSGYNDELCRGFYDGMFSDFDPDYPNGGSANPYTTEVFKIGEIMNYGKFWMYDKYIVPGGCPPYPWTPSTAASQRTFEIYHVHGDPTMEIWTTFPQNLSVNYPGQIPFGYNVLQVAVTDEGGTPVEGALVCLSQPGGIYMKGFTDPSGIATIEVLPFVVDDISVVVTAHNYLYYEGTIGIIVLDHNIGLGSVSAPSVLMVDEMGWVNTTVHNNGIYNESDVEVQLLADGFVVNSTIINMLQSGESIDISFNWCESSVGVYNVSIYAVPVPDEPITYDNLRTVQIAVTHFPYAPNNPGPESGATNISIDTNLSWLGGDPDAGDQVRYHIYLGKNLDPPRWDVTDWYPHDMILISFDSDKVLDLSSTYYWKVIAEDTYGALNESDLWEFSTVGRPPVVYIDDDFDSSTPGWGYDHFDNIQNGSDFVEGNGTIYVYNGTYNGNIVFDRPALLIGEDRNSTFIFTSSGDYGGIRINADQVQVSGFTIDNSGGGAIKTASSYNVITDNSISDDGAAIRLLTGSSYNLITQNLFTGGYCGIRLDGETSYNMIYENEIRDNHQGNGNGINVRPDAHDNHIYHNNFINNGNNVLDESSNNTWDIGYPAGGNYWDDHPNFIDLYSGPEQDIPGSDGIVDTGYVTNGDTEEDHYPFMTPWIATIPGDLDYDADIDVDDYWLFVETYGRTIGDPLYNPEVDYNLNGHIDLVDYQTWMSYFFDFTAIIPGDLNFDGIVDLNDLAQIISHYGTISDALYHEGDVDCDGDVDLSDLVELLVHYGEGT